VLLDDKLAVVTGGGRRLGRAMVEALAETGARPVVHFNRSRADAEALARRTGGVAIQADLGQPEGARQLVDQVLRLEGHLGLWINNASTFERRGFGDTDDSLWRETLQLVLLTPVSCIRAVAPRMRPEGLIVNILDVAAHQPWRGYSHHCVAKAALAMLTRVLALELAPEIRVCGISPGVVLPADDLSEGEKNRLIRRAPLQRPGAPHDVVRAMRYLIDADFATGTVLTVDGGLTARSPV
jgi:pteridine reductase